MLTKGVATAMTTFVDCASQATFGIISGHIVAKGERVLQQADGDLIEKICLDNDQRAFETLYDRYDNLVFSVSARMLGRDLASEMLQEIFLLVWRKACDFESKRGSFKSWLMQITRNRSIDELRRMPPTVSAPADEENEWFDMLVDDAPNPEEQAFEDDRAAQVRGALTELPKEQREVILLAYFKGFSQSQIATKLNLPLGTVKKRVRLGMQKLKVSLMKEHAYEL